jgi:hypothetical protein
MMGARDKKITCPRGQVERGHAPDVGLEETLRLRVSRGAPGYEDRST